MKNLNYIKHDKTTWRKDLYCNSKLCDVLAAQEFAKKLKRFNIMVNSVDPGIVDTNLFPSSYGISPSWLYEVLTYITLKIIGTVSTVVIIRRRKPPYFNEGKIIFAP